MNQLSTSDPHYYEPIKDVHDFLCDRLPAHGEVLEIGPGHNPFAKANVFVDLKEHNNLPSGSDFHKLDATSQRLPFPPKSFDFVYCRHVLEDVYNPFFLLQEMQRVAISGYIETPSPIAELCRGVDGGSPYYRGYHHHQFMCWHSGQGLRFLAKYPCVEYLDIDQFDLPALLRSGPIYWNTYYLWDDAIMWRHLQNTHDFCVARDYRALLIECIKESKRETMRFWTDTIGIKAPAGAAIKEVA